MSNCRSPFAHAPGYAWVCHSCKAVNAPGRPTCQTCGFQAIATGEEIQEALTGIKRPPTLSRNELQRQRRQEMAALPLWKKPIAYFLRMVEFIGGLIATLGIFYLAGSQVLLGFALVFVAEVSYQLLKGKSDGQQTASQ